MQGRAHPREMQPTGCPRDSAGRLRRGGGMVGRGWCSPGARLFRAPTWCPSGGGGTREAGGIVAESLVALYRVGTHQIRRGRRAARSSTSQGSAEPLCARIKGVTWKVSEGKADLQGPTRIGEWARFVGRFSGMHRALGGWILPRAPASPAQGLHHRRPRYFNLLYFCMTCGFEKLGLFDQNCSERDFPALLLRKLAVGRR